MPPTLLLVDDDADYRALLSEFLASLGHSVVACDSGPEALRHMEEGGGEACRLVLTDMRMPHMTGLELAQALRRTHPRLPIILMTAYGERRLHEDAVALGHSAYLEKPFRLGELQKAIEHALAANGV